MATTPTLYAPKGSLVMPVIEETIDIRAPIDLVFTVVTDPKRGGEWNGNIIEVRDVAPLPVREGTTWKQVTSVLSRPVELSCRILQFRPPYEGLLQITGPLNARIRTTCKTVDTGTRVTQRLEYDPPRGVPGLLARGIAGPALQREVVRTLQRQREVLEGEVSEPGVVP